MIDLVPAWVDGALLPVEKLKVHQRGLRHKAVSVFVMRGTEILIQKRAATKYHTPGLWANTCCTHPLWGETPIDCAIRRLREELGISGLFPAHRDRVEYRAEVGSGLTEHELVDIFVAEVSGQLRVAPNPNEVAEVRWVDFYDLTAEVARRPDEFTPWLRIYLEEHAAKIFGALVRA